MVMDDEEEEQEDRCCWWWVVVVVIDFVVGLSWDRKGCCGGEVSVVALVLLVDCRRPKKASRTFTSTTSTSTSTTTTARARDHCVFASNQRWRRTG
jgi:hypothetical protein